MSVRVERGEGSEVRFDILLSALENAGDVRDEISLYDKYKF
jgi:hypothetical protein